MPDKKFMIGKEDHRKLVIIDKRGNGERQERTVVVLVLYHQPFVFVMNSVFVVGKKVYEIHRCIAQYQ